MKKKILVIDDEEPIRKLFTRILSAAGYEVITASHGKEALAVLDNRSFDLIVLDMNMPEMDGLTFLRRVREGDLTHVPVLMVSGEDNPENIVESYKLGVYDFIRKPERTEVMLKRIENGLKIGEMIHFNDFIRVELMMARKLQKYMYPSLEMTSERVSLHTWTLPLSDIGGDLYDYVLFRDDRVVFFVADVSGHSISAALYTAIVKMVFRNALQKTDMPGELMAIMNQELAGNIPVESFVTAFCGLYDPSRGLLRYANAGHPQPYLIAGDEWRLLEGNDSFLGPIRDAAYQTRELSLGKNGGAILAITDGILDALNERGELAGRSLLAGVLEETGITPMEKFLRIQQKITGGEYSVNDDCTMMLVEMF